MRSRLRATVRAPTGVGRGAHGRAGPRRRRLESIFPAIFRTLTTIRNDRGTRG
ncbi:MAG: hypothetical protein AVDCRST_MAG19-1140 [uncultured Thermomicrobiales bacterium]|uniref:Uncharacterized protein n=1 Tax=uncultured Thermomicrobiales bacterium TaxID=1645740 RepID=A0A6J4UPD6_9BACT|nr:MAG: hypothetical protein AVDCRST_MAG19-1140 [uncultured Thermomicrobiales bacterium]